MSEALERAYDAAERGFSEGLDPTALAERMVDAALAVLVRCPTCDGKSYQRWENHANSCPTCDGRGWSPVVLGEGGKVLESREATNTGLSEPWFGIVARLP